MHNVHNNRNNQIIRIVRERAEHIVLLVMILTTPPLEADSTYNTIYNMERPVYEEEGTTPIRANAIKEVAYHLAVQAAVKERYTKIIAILNGIDTELSELTSFKPLMLDSFVMPPVIVSTDGTTRLIDHRQIVQTDASYKILKTSTMVLRTPSWRDYLLGVSTPVEEPHSAVLPETAPEKNIWQAATKKGWADGVKHANRLFQLRWNKLITDYIGMVNYHLLATQKMVTDPNVATANHPVFVSTDGTELEINKQQWVLTKPTGFTNPDQWQAIVSQSHKQ